MIKKLETEDITKLLAEFSWPAVAGMVIHSCYNIVSRIFIGNAGDAAGLNGLAALTVSFPMMIIMFSVAGLCGLGGSSLYSIKLGEKKYDEAEKILGISMVIVTLLSLILAAAFYLNLEPLLIYFGASDTILPYAKAYMTVILIGNVFGGLSFTVNAFVRADGSPSTAMFTMIIGALFNIIFTPLFIYVFNWGMTGAGLATVGGQILTMTWVICYFLGNKSNTKITPKIFKIEFPLLKRIVAMGIPPFVMQLINSLIMLVINRSLIIYGGDIAMSAMGIIHSIQTILLMPIVGISQGAQPIIGYNFGAGSLSRVAETVKKAAFFATISVFTFYIILRIFPVQAMSLFSPNRELQELGAHCMNIWFLAFPIVGIQIIGSNYFQAVGKVIPSLILTVTRQLIFLIPAMLIFPMFWGFDGLLYAAPTADVLATLVTGIWLYLDINKSFAAQRA